MKKVRQLRDSDGASVLPPAPAIEPGAAVDAASTDGRIEAALLADKQGGVEMFLRLVVGCLPAKSSCGGARRWKAGYSRFVAIAYARSPELFLGMKQEDVAKSLGITLRAFEKQLREVRAEIGAARQSVTRTRRR